jgi:phosphatidylglycerophosphate synthase
LRSPELRAISHVSLAAMNLPNILTISRVPLMFIVVGLMYAEFRWAATAAFWLFIAAALTDWLDGKIARERGIVSSFGRFMDAVIDKVLVIGVMIALVNGDYFSGEPGLRSPSAYSIVAMMLLFCILCREFAISGMRMAAASKGMIVEADRGGKMKTFVQLNAIGWLMGARMLRNDSAGIEPHVVDIVRWVGSGLFVLSAVLTITSGISYLRRHGHVLMS